MKLDEAIQIALNNGIGSIVPCGAVTFDYCDDLDDKFYQFAIQIWRNKTGEFEIVFKIPPSNDTSEITQRIAQTAYLLKCVYEP